MCLRKILRVWTIDCGLRGRCIVWDRKSPQQPVPVEQGHDGESHHNIHRGMTEIPSEKSTEIEMHFHMLSALS